VSSLRLNIVVRVWPVVKDEVWRLSSRWGFSWVIYVACVAVVTLCSCGQPFAVAEKGKSKQRESASRLDVRSSMVAIDLQK
jgi:hypothetical protein